MDHGPPPLPLRRPETSGESPFLTYGRAVVILLPGLFAIVLVLLVLLPKLRSMWRLIGHDAADSMLDRYFMRHVQSLETWHFYFLIPGVFLLFVFLELRVKIWRRWRSFAVTSILVTVNALLMIVICAVAVAALAVGPAAGKKMAEKQAEKNAKADATPALQPAR